MKRTLTLLAILAAIGPAWGAEVVSSNIVGYEKVSLNAGYNMVGVQFTKIGGDALGLGTVGTMDNETAGFNEDQDFAATMQIWNGNGYDFYGWSGTSGTDLLDNSDLDNQWVDANSLEPITETAENGSGFWIKMVNPGTVTISGEVPSTDTVTVSIVTGYNIVANPYPGAVSIASWGTPDASFAGFNEDQDFALTMQVWNGNGYDFYGWSGTSGTDLLDDATVDNKWVDANSLEPVNTPIPFGTAVWIKATSAGNITFSAPSAD